MEEIAQIDQESSGLGNTNSKPKQPSMSKRWCFTWNNYTSDEYSSIAQILREQGFSYIIGEEVASTGTPHLQGYIEKKQRFRPSQLKLCNKIHWEKARGTRDDNIKYCSKENKYITNFHINSMVRTIDPAAFYPYQKWLINTIETIADDRTIFWIWDEMGNIGKSAIAKFIVIKYNAIVVDGKGSDIFNGVHNYKDEKGFFPEIIIVDCPRHNIGYINYGALEKLKNGLIFNGKYESKMLIFNPPHVIVFANSEPDETKYSNDRLVIKKIVNKLDMLGTPVTPSEA